MTRKPDDEGAEKLVQLDKADQLEQLLALDIQDTSKMQNRKKHCTKRMRMEARYLEKKAHFFAPRDRFGEKEKPLQRRPQHSKAKGKEKPHEEKSLCSQVGATAWWFVSVFFWSLLSVFAVR